jgi:hypothetical protein
MREHETIRNLKVKINPEHNGKGIGEDRLREHETIRNLKVKINPEHNGNVVACRPRDDIVINM